MYLLDFHLNGSLLSDNEQSIILQPIELMAISRNAHPCREMEIAERLSGKME